MRPHALIESSPESLNTDEISRGKLLKRDAGGVIQKSFDLLTSFKDVLGRKVCELPANYEKGELLKDTAMDLETNVSNDFAGDNSLLLKRGPLSPGAVVKMAQTFRTGTNDIDALDFVQMYLRDPSGNLIEIDWPDVGTLDRSRIPEMKLLTEFAEQNEEGLAASLYLDRPHLKTARRAR